MFVRIVVLPLLAVAIFAYGCAQTVALRGAQAVPAALGEAKVSRDDNGNTILTIEVEHLAPPENLSQPKSVYVVWAQVPQGRIVNLGQMNVGKDRSGRFVGVTPLTQFRILVTAEDLAAVATPSKEEILSTEVFTVN